MVKLTPGMQQYMNVKNANPDCVILFRMGDFYETFFEDAKVIARELEITLTARGKGDTKAPLAGIPYHAIEPYIAKLVKKGYKVGIVEQIEDPKKAKGLVKRALTRIITPGTVVENMILDKGSNNYILSFNKNKETFFASYCDVSTGEFLTGEFNEDEFLNEVSRINPAEIICPMSLSKSEIVEKLKSIQKIVNEYDDRFFYIETAKETLYKHFDVLNLEGFGLTQRSMIECCGALISYIKEKQMNELRHVTKIQLYRNNEFMFLDNSTIRNLELIKNIVTNDERGTLLSVIDKTITPMGKRLMKKWIKSPLISKKEIEKRLDVVNEFKEDLIFRHELKEHLKNVYDIERLIGRISFGNANPKDLVALGTSLVHIPKIKELLWRAKSKMLKDFSEIPTLEEAKNIILKSIKDEPNSIIREGNIIRGGYNKELDDLRKIKNDARSYLEQLEEEEKEKTGIKSLKIRYNKVIGYFIEVTKSNLSLIPKEYIRKQSQLNSERFVTEELKELEVKILGAQERIYELEYNLFMEILEELKEYITGVQEVSNCVGIVDCLCSFSVVSQERNYCRPHLNEEGILEIKDSRHAVIEQSEDIDFISNDCKLSNEKRTMIITGPNMAGKSTYLRQIALSCLMAQMGCFVPTSLANICIMDRIFSRIGAYDDLVNHQSTFMVEMNETANILNNATENSLVILDEIGRGTSTYDGVSLAWAIAEFLNNKIKCKTLFATHYHHLNKLSGKFEGINNFNIAVDEHEDKILFLRKIVEGGTDKSYGIQVAKLAGLPKEVIDSAKEVMNLIEFEDDLGEKMMGEEERQGDDKNQKIEVKKEEKKEVKKEEEKKEIGEWRGEDVRREKMVECSEKKQGEKKEEGRDEKKIQEEEREIRVEKEKNINEMKEKIMNDLREKMEREIKEQVEKSFGGTS